MNNKREEMLVHLRKVSEAIGISVTDEQYALFAAYYVFLFEYNKKVNLTRITEPMEVAVKHFGDSLTVLKAADFFPGSQISDIGTGAGFPGMPIAVMRPDIQVTLVDSLRKRTNFLNEAVQLMGLNNVSVVWSRAEDLGHNPLYRESFDFVLARAVAPLNVLTELCMPLLKVGGIFLAMKGPKAGDEISAAKNAIAKLGGILLSTEIEPLPFVGETRVLIRIAKRRGTPASYPRKAGIPERQPLT